MVEERHTLEERTVYTEGTVPFVYFQGVQLAIVMTVIVMTVIKLFQLGNFTAK